MTSRSRGHRERVLGVREEWRRLREGRSETHMHEIQGFSGD